MNELKQKSELLGIAKKALDECIAAGIDEPKCKFENRLCDLVEMELCSKFELYEFHLRIVECKQVFNGDVLYSESHPNGYKIFDVIGDLSLYGFSWNPPKPKTVMVKLSVDVARSVADKAATFQDVYEVEKACGKALKELEDSK